MAGHTDFVTVERVIPQPAEAIFAILVDPARHREIDGSGTVRDPKTPPQTLALGSKFRMAMRVGIPYSMVSTVVEFEENQRIAWQTRGPGRIGQFGGGRIWRYELEPVEGGTLVRETWDISQEAALTKPLVRPAAERTRRGMEATLERIDAVLAHG